LSLAAISKLWEAGSTVNIETHDFANGTKNKMGGNFSGVNPMRDIPMFARLIETGQFDAKSMIQVFPLEKSREAYEAAAYRTSVASVVTIA